MQDGPADDLDIEMAHGHLAPGHFADHGEGFGQDIVEGGSLADFLPEFARLGLQLVIGQFLETGFKNVDFVNKRKDFL